MPTAIFDASEAQPLEIGSRFPTRHDTSDHEEQRLDETWEQPTKKAREDSRHRLVRGILRYCQRFQTPPLRECGQLNVDPK